MPAILTVACADAQRPGIPREFSGWQDAPMPGGRIGSSPGTLKIMKSTMRQAACRRTAGSAGVRAAHEERVGRPQKGRAE
jgi:hypothetical protein